MRTALFTDDLFLQHDTGQGHPECSSRLISIRKKLERQPYFGEFRELERRFASEEEIALVHDLDYIKKLREFTKTGGGYLDGDTPAVLDSFDAASLAAGVGLAAADAILDGTLDRAILLVRPPGHHALPSRAMGFCLFNNIAICARYLQKKGIKKIGILDWDVHHGNGTEAAFYEDPGIFFVSMHHYPFYPGTGAASDRGRNGGEGFTLNIPMPGNSSDDDYRAVFLEKVIPALTSFAPEILLISAGFDAHQMDPLGGMNLTTDMFQWMTEKSVELAASCCQDRIISFLEGGYHLQALADSVAVHAAALL